MKRLIAAVVLGLTLAQGAVAGTTVQRKAVKTSHGTRLTYLMRVAIIGDPQHYFTRVIPEANLPVAANLFRLEIDDIIEYRPSFAIIVGDLTDGPSGPDENCSNWLISDDIDLSGAVLGHPAGFFQQSWAEIRAQGVDRLLAAGIPVFTVLGNHDSCVEYTRYFPVSEWTAAYAGEVDSRANKCGGGTFSGTCASPTYGASANLAVDTTHRKALYPTPIGTVCVIGMPDGTDTDAAWIQARVGCSANRPTILVGHKGAFVIGGLNAQQMHDTIADVWGHFTPCVDCVGAPPPLSTHALWVGLPAGLTHVVMLFDNQQEQISGDQGSSGGLAHTGMSWWMSWEINPLANTSTTQAHNPYLGGISDPPPGSHFTMANSSLTLPYSWCTEFGCP